MSQLHLHYFNKNIYLVLAVVFAITSCKQPETIVIDREPDTPSPDTAAADTIPEDAQFKQINIGELNSIPSLDPLFARNTSVMRTLQLVYEGLLRYNKNGNLVPGIAKSWSVSSDSLTYTFNLRDNVFYHDSEAFPNGLGRKLTARDVRFIFERMASVYVPDEAARLFMHIHGFEPYYQEQHHVYNPEDRQLKTITGISTPNDTTVVFRLVEKDSHFLQKLASPYALIYPRESVTPGTPGSFKTVGTGPFKLSEKQDSTRYIFSKFKDYYGNPLPKLNRVDVIIQQNEPELFQSFVKGEIDWITEMGPQLIEGVLNSSGRLKSSYEPDYNLHQSAGGLNYKLKYNPGSYYPRRYAMAMGRLVDSTFTIYPEANFVSISLLQSNSDSSVLPDTTIFSYTEDPFTSWFIARINEKLSQKGSVVQMQNIKTPTRNTGLFFTQFIPLYSSQQITGDPNTLIEFSFRHVALSQKRVRELPINRFPWWIDLRETTISDSQ